jgi:integrator complex subunit 9
MNTGRHDLLYVPEMPLAHGNMQTGSVQTLPSLEAVALTGKELREPCIVFTGDPTCITKGFLPWFLNRWEQSELNTCVFIDPDTLNIQDDIPSGCNMNFIRLPLDTKLKLEDIPSLLHSYWDKSLENTQHLLIPRMKGAELVKEEQSQSKVYIYEPGEVISIDLNRDWEYVSISEKVNYLLISPYKDD